MYINTTTYQYPLSERDIRAAYPNTSFPTPFMAPDGYAWVFPTPSPDHNAVIEYTREVSPALTTKGTWEQRWEVAKQYDKQTDESAAIAADAAQKQQQIQDSIVAATQQRLDDFAKTRNYDSILSAATYATSPTTKFYTEGQYAVNCRDATWATLYSILAEVKAGTRAMPSSYADIEAELPVLEWSV